MHPCRLWVLGTRKATSASLTPPNPGPNPRPPLVGTQKYFVVAGQHAYSAAQAIRTQLQAGNKQEQRWTTHFRCSVLRDGLDLNTIRKVAGKIQAASQSVRALSFADTMEMVLKLEPQFHQSRMELMRAVYDDSGKSVITDGTKVRSL